MKFDLIGPYFAYKKERGDKIYIKRIELDKEGEMPNFTVDLSDIVLDKIDYDFINFFPVLKSSFRSVKYHHAESIVYYDNLIQVIIKNKSMVFHLDTEKKQLVEVTFIDNC